ncbi:RUS1 FAMILY PROTEIN C16ORF58 [Salix koriyanagi]|uniref:RUS1 FAMILY PROTEIN C16ORF58 n=1 Tax=Salix koriyanagi TaxID=2511006 RepID=A0A9Q0QMT5_9ROSI|nr:RUS1 FAMILY PROTEIN C16ORF58 [Salix koriyanagi]
MARLLSPAQHEELEHQSQSTGSKPLILSLTASSLNPMVNSLSARDICMQTTGECSASSVYHRVVESFLNKFFPSGYPCSVKEGYLRCTRFRALQHFSRAALSVLFTQS